MSIKHKYKICFQKWNVSKKNHTLSQEAIRNCALPKTKQQEVEKKSALDQERGEAHARKSVKGDALGRGLGRAWITTINFKNGKLLFFLGKLKVELNEESKHSILYAPVTNKTYIDIIT